MKNNMISLLACKYTINGLNSTYSLENLVELAKIDLQKAIFDIETKESTIEHKLLYATRNSFGNKNDNSNFLNLIVYISLQVDTKTTYSVEYRNIGNDKFDKIVYNTQNVILNDNGENINYTKTTFNDFALFTKDIKMSFNDLKGLQKVEISEILNNYKKEVEIKAENDKKVELERIRLEKVENDKNRQENEDMKVELARMKSEFEALKNEKSKIEAQKVENDKKEAQKVELTKVSTKVDTKPQNNDKKQQIVAKSTK